MPGSSREDYIKPQAGKVRSGAPRRCRVLCPTPLVRTAAAIRFVRKCARRFILHKLARLRDLVCPKRSARGERENSPQTRTIPLRSRNMTRYVTKRTTATVRVLRLAFPDHLQN
ncbi:hypothetical protein THAOC_15374 [Thalassiosira oceanica]|uniref:Uncharacterized protein n=1 Tax=Thalassiosira oceanica TaxID=159749 RepID=K0SG06_THAOC|nr:hypothetical protein THAOC_15374 [Thalassiosira oceanica]|eukprot:EJK63939.1 hypothetical protein THAOC_15374 [Thalassiosira oceanica]